jgi:methylmalonyl-CoA decarboxylase subunit alpha
MEFRKEYAPSMVTGFIRLNGMTVGCVANRTEVYDENGDSRKQYDAYLSEQGCEKAARFVGFCDAFDIPVLTLVNVKGYEATLSSEKNMARASAKLTYAFACATIPKVTVMIGQAFGSAYLTMNSKSIGADMVYAWPASCIGMMDSTEAVKIMYASEIAKAEDGKSMIQEKAKEYEELQSSAISAAKRGYVDDIIDASETRARVIAAFEMLFTKREERPAKKHGTI